MGPFIIIALIILLILIVISVFAYPLICANIAIASKRFNGIVTGFLLLITIALYLFACTTLEDSFDNWCYSVYAGIVLTPIFLYFGTGLEEPGRWPDSGEKAQHNKITIPVLTFLTSSLFTIEGVLRMAHSNSVHRILNYGWGEPDTDSYRFYYEEFHYAGSLLFFVSLFSALIIGVTFFSSYKEYRRKQVVEAEKKSRIEREVNEVTQNLKADSDLFMSFESQQIDEALQYYYAFCQKIIAALESSDEKAKYTFGYCAFNNLESPFKVLMLTNSSRCCYFYPMGIVFKNQKDSYKYVQNVTTTVLLRTEQKNMSKPLPYDVRPIRQYWLHSCRDGSPDLRYNYNPKTYVYEYANLNVAELILHVFRLNTAKEVVSAYNKMYSYISELKQQKHHEKKNPLSEEKPTTFNAITEKKESITKVERQVETKTAKQHVAIDNPKTLEECFSVIILKRGTNILKDDKLVGLISSYKDVDISEYKDVLERMVSDNFLYQFTETGKQNDFALYNLCSSFARQNKVNAQKVLFITQALVNAIKTNSKNQD